MLDFRLFSRGVDSSSCAERITVGCIGSPLIRLLLGGVFVADSMGVLVVVAGRFCWVVASEEKAGLRSASEAGVAS